MVERTALHTHTSPTPHTHMHASTYLLALRRGNDPTAALSALWQRCLAAPRPVFTYLFGAMAAMTAPLTLRKPPGLHDVPSSSSVKILRAPGPV